MKIKYMHESLNLKVKMKVKVKVKPVRAVRQDVSSRKREIIRCQSDREISPSSPPLIAHFFLSQCIVLKTSCTS